MLNEAITLEEYWAWAHGNLVANSERGLVAEFLVGKATDSLGDGRVERDAWDLTTDYGAKIEVKASGYVQTWDQTKPSSIRLKMDESGGWDARSKEYSSIRTRRADVYVFCVHAERNKEKMNPLRPEQWEFVVLPTSVLNEKLGSQKTVGLSTLLSIGGEGICYEALSEAIRAAAT